MQFFKHMTNMRNDPKMKRVFRKYGLEGYGLYNLILESIAESITSDRPMPELEETCDDIAEDYHANSARIEEITKYFITQGLFTFEEITGRVICEKIYKYLQSSQTRSPEIKAMISNYQKTKQIALSQTVSDSLRQSQIVSDCLSKSRIDIDKDKDKETEKDNDDVLPLSEKIGQPTDIDKLIQFWNRIDNLPEFRMLSFNIPDIGRITEVCSHFTFGEITAAMNTYSEMLANSADCTFLPRYPTVVSFLHKGVPVFFPGADPRKTFGKPGIEPKKAKVAKVYWYVCDTCGCKYETAIGNCPECFKAKRMSMASKLFEGNALPDDCVIRGNIG